MGASTGYQAGAGAGSLASEFGVQDQPGGGLRIDDVYMGGPRRRYAKARAGVKNWVELYTL